jgi:transcriptional regulator with XRE-family HTH domain
MSKQKLPPIDGEHREYALRFRQALRWAGWIVYDEKTSLKISGSYEDAAKKLGVTRAYVGDLYRGMKFPSGKTGIDIANKLGVSSNWLNAGKGPMVADQMISIEHLAPEDQQLILRMVRAMESSG